MQGGIIATFLRIIFCKTQINQYSILRNFCLNVFYTYQIGRFHYKGVFCPCNLFCSIFTLKSCALVQIISYIPYFPRYILDIYFCGKMLHLIHFIKIVMYSLKCSVRSDWTSKVLPTFLVFNKDNSRTVNRILKIQPRFRLLM